MRGATLPPPVPPVAPVSHDTVAGPTSQTLLDWKASLYDPYNSLGSWQSYSDPCLYPEWPYVECATVGGSNRVVGLQVSFMGLAGPLDLLSQLDQLQVRAAAWGAVLA